MAVTCGVAVPAADVACLCFNIDNPKKYTDMTKEEKTLLTKVLCEQLPYGVFVKENRFSLDDGLVVYTSDYHPCIDNCKPYLRPLPSMTESEALDIAKLLLFADKRQILNVATDDKGINIIVDDGVSSTEGIFYYYDEIVKSLEIFDYLNAKHFDVRGILPNGLGIAAVGDDNPYKEKGGGE